MYIDGAGQPIGDDYEETPPKTLRPTGYDNEQVRGHVCVYNYPDEWVSDITTFCCEDNAIKACNEYQQRNCCALVHARGGGRSDLKNGKKGLKILERKKYIRVWLNHVLRTDDSGGQASLLHW